MACLLANLYAQRIPSSVTRYKACLASDPTVPVGLAIWQAVKDRTSTAGEPTAEEQQEEALVEAWNKERRTELDAEFERAVDRVFYKNMKEAYHSVKKDVLQGRRCYYLEHLYVHRDHQRKGIGKALLEIGMRKADEEGVECYLEASLTGQPLYERNGFEIKEWVEIKEGDDYVTRLPAMMRAPSKMS
ncbi:GNAT domain [Phaffia rhodozyma]|uniref:GNAT domain n=1 Tax=Phaffia rhodozyma TaxID=264483 RepID=A0A0F7SM44_PHARH|nr:GNAT domain [Phaffia rhodozyma]